MKVSSINTALIGHGNYYHQNKTGMHSNPQKMIGQNIDCGDTVSFKGAIGGGVGTLLGGAAGLGLALLAAAGSTGVIVASMIGGAIGGINGDINQPNPPEDDDDFNKFSYADYDDFIYESHRL